MAEFALGLTKTAVEGTLSLVKSALEEEKKLREAVQNDLVFITGEFEVMQSFLHVANRERAASDVVALTLVRQLRTLAFDVEDCVEYVVHLDLDKSSTLGGLRRAWQTVNCRAPPLPLDVAVAEIKQLKARVEDVSQRNTRYNLILNSSDDNKQQQHHVTITAEPPPPPYATSAFHVLRDAWKATGKWSSNMCDFRQELLVAREGDLRVTSVWGSTTSSAADDLGTASIFSKAYCDPAICEKFRRRAWVKLTHPFNHDDFVKSLLTQLCATTSHQANNVEFTQGNLMRAKKAMMQQMRSQRYLVVLEDVLTVAEWDVIRMYLPESKNGSRVLLSTPHLSIALLCTGEPYQVSELRKFSSDNQFLCAFSKKEKMPNDIGEFYHHLQRHQGVVISVWGADDDDDDYEKSNLVDILYKGIINGWLEEIEGVADKSDHVDMLFKGVRNKRIKPVWHSSWVDVPAPFDLKVFAQRLFLNFHSDDIRAKRITEVGMKGEAGLIEWCREFLSSQGNDHNPYVVVINGLESKDDWDLIQGTFLLSSSDVTKARAGCILVITNEETVATHVVKDHTHLAFNVKDLRADPSISTLIEKGCWQYAIRGKKGRLFYDRRKDAREWINKFEDVGGINLDNNPPDEEEGKAEEEGFRVHTVSTLWNNDSRRSCVLRHAYYGALSQQETEQVRCRISWVDLPSVDADLDLYSEADYYNADLPWDDDLDGLRDFSWHLLLEFYSDDPQAKEAAAVGLMEGTVDPIEKCREFLRNEKCLLVINRLRSEEDWFSIKDTFFSEQHIRCSVVMSRDAERPAGTSTEEQGHLIYMEYRRIFSTQKRYQEAIQWVETCQPIGRDSEVAMLGRYAYHGSLLSVWGIPSVGMSTIARTVYYNEILRSSGFEPKFCGNEPHEAFAWVDIPSPFSLTEFAWRLLLAFYYDDPQARETAAVSMMEEGRQVPILDCCKILRTGLCWVVMDGLRSKQDWDLIKTTFLAEDIQATIVVITNEEEVAIHCVENVKERAINITRLEANVALRLLEKVTYGEIEVPNSIVNKCGGLPKVIAAVGPCMLLDSLRRNFMGTLETDPRFHGLRPLFSWLQSYFDACSDSIKPCIFYLSIFSADKNIRLRRLLWRWIAEGYCRDTSDGRTCEENAEKFISELINLSIIQEPASSKVFCQINGFFHEYIISRPMEDNLVFALEEGCSLNSQRTGQHLTIRRSWDRRDRIVYESIDFSRLRSLTVFGEWKPFFICSKKVNMRLLRVLDLEDATDVTNEDLDKIAKLLTRLKFLSLRGHTKITCLPISMGGLRQLQTLDIRGTFIVMLPPFITKLQKLQYIRAGTTEVDDILPAAPSSEQAVTNLPTEEGANDSIGSPVLPADDAAGSSSSVTSLLFKLCRRGGSTPPTAGVTVPADIGKLAVLHTLGVVKVNKQAIFEALKQLTQLCKLGVSGINKGNIQEFCSAIADHARLRSLSVELDKDDGLDDNIPLPPKTVKRLKLYGHVRKLLLVWLEYLGDLEKVHLTVEKPEELQDLPELSNKPYVDHLRIRPIQSGELRFGTSCWIYVKAVEIQCSSTLHVNFHREDGEWGVSPSVLKVHFSGGSESSLQISGLDRLVELKEVWLRGYTNAHKQYMQQQINDMELVLLNQERPVLKLVPPSSS